MSDAENVLLLNQHLQADEVHRKLGFRELVAIGVASVLGIAGGANTANAEDEDTEIIPNKDFVVDAQVDPGNLIIGNVTALNRGNGDGWVAVYGDEYKGTSTVNTSEGQNLPNAFVADPGTDGKIGIYVGGTSNRHVIIDKIAQLEKNPFVTVFDSPIRLKDTRSSGEVVSPSNIIEVNFGKEYAGKFAVANLTIAGAKGPGWYATYPCADGYKGTSSINVKGGGSQAILNLVKVDKEGKACIKSSESANGIVVDFLGTFDSVANPFERKLDSRETGRMLRAGKEKSIVVGKPNSVFVGTIVSANPSGPGYVAAYTNSGEYAGTSTLNSDGTHPVANMVIMKTDEKGAIQLYAEHIDTHVIVDGTEMPELSPFLEDDANRLLDTRATGIPFELPPQYHCDKAVWIEAYDDGNMAYALYDERTNNVTRYSTFSSEMLSIFNFEIDPSVCNEPSVVYSLPDGKRGGLFSPYRKNLSTGSEERIPTPAVPAQYLNAYYPDATTRDVAFNSRSAPNTYPPQSTIGSANGKIAYGVGIEEFSISDSAALTADLRRYLKPGESPDSKGSDGSLIVTRINYDTPGQSEIWEYRYTHGKEQLKKVEASNDSSGVYVLRSTDSGSTFKLYKVTKGQPKETGVYSANLEEVKVNGINGSTISSYRVLSGSIIMIIEGKSPVRLDMVTGTATELGSESLTIDSAKM